MTLRPITGIAFALLVTCSVPAVAQQKGAAPRPAPAAPSAPRPAAAAPAAGSTQDAELQSLRKRHHAGELDAEQARAAFDALPDTAWVRQQLGAAAAQIEAQVAAGQLSEDDAARLTGETRAHLRAMAFAMGVLGLSADEARVRAAMETTGVSREEAQTQIAERVRAREQGADAASEGAGGVPHDGAADAASEGTASEGARAPRDARAAARGRDGAKAAPRDRPAAQGGGDAGPRAAPPEQDAGAANGRPRRAGGAPADPLAFTLAPLAKAGIAPEALGDVRATIETLVPMVRKQGPGFALPQSLQDRFASLGLTDEQIRLVRALAVRADDEASGAAAFEHLGVSRETFDAMRAQLPALGVAAERTDVVVKGLAAVATAMAAGDPGAPMDDKARASFHALGLDDAQVAQLEELVRQALATREVSEDAASK